MPRNCNFGKKKNYWVFLFFFVVVFLFPKSLESKKKGEIKLFFWIFFLIIVSFFFNIDIKSYSTLFHVFLYFIRRRRNRLIRFQIKEKKKFCFLQIIFQYFSYFLFALTKDYIWFLLMKEKGQKIKNKSFSNWFRFTFCN